MTTNKPEVAGFISEVGIKKLREDEYTGDWTLYAGPVRNSTTPLIRLSDYEALQAECERLRQDVEALQGIQPEMPPMPPNGKGLPRYGVRWNGPTQPLSVPKDDGYWTPWHLAQAECESLRRDAERYRYLADECCAEWCGEKGPVLVHATSWTCNWRVELDAAIDAAMQGGQP